MVYRRLALLLLVLLGVGLVLVQQRTSFFTPIVVQLLALDLLGGFLAVAIWAY